MASSRADFENGRKHEGRGLQAVDQCHQHKPIHRDSRGEVSDGPPLLRFPEIADTQILKAGMSARGPRIFMYEKSNPTLTTFPRLISHTQRVKDDDPR